MEKPAGYDNAESADSGRMQPPGRPYILGVVGVGIQPSKQNPSETVMFLQLDIAEGTFKNYYRNLSDRLNKDCFLKFYQGTGGKSLTHFKGLITSFEKSNNFVFDFNERSLIRKKIGANCYEQQYVKNDGTVGTILKIDHLCSVHHVTNGDLKILPVRELSDDEYDKTSDKQTEQNQPTQPEEDDLPF